LWPCSSEWGLFVEETLMKESMLKPKHLNNTDIQAWIEFLNRFSIPWEIAPSGDTYLILFKSDTSMSGKGSLNPSKVELQMKVLFDADCRFQKLTTGF
jgi:hypothetical protein